MFLNLILKKEVSMSNRKREGSEYEMEGDLAKSSPKKEINTLIYSGYVLIGLVLFLVVVVVLFLKIDKNIEPQKTQHLTQIEYCNFSVIKEVKKKRKGALLEKHLTLQEIQPDGTMGAVNEVLPRNLPEVFVHSSAEVGSLFVQCILKPTKKIKKDNKDN